MPAIAKRGGWWQTRGLHNDCARFARRDRAKSAVTNDTMTTAKPSHPDTHILISGVDEAIVSRMLNNLVTKGARVVSPPSRLGNHWVATCTNPEAEDPAGAGPRVVNTAGPKVKAENVSEMERRAQDAAQRAADRPVTVSDAGSAMLVSGGSQVAVKAALDALIKKGARLVAPVTRVGETWVGSCESPTESANACTVESMGHSRMITGPSRHAVEARVGEFTSFGARLVGEIEEVDGKWTALLDTGHL